MGNKINYNLVVSQATDIKDLSTELDIEISNLENLLEQIKSDWHGPASNEVQNQLLILIANMKMTRHNMSNASSIIIDVANKTI